MVVESLTVQSMPPAQHAVAAETIAALVAPQGTLLVLATTREEGAEVQGPPWPLTRAELEEFATNGLTLRPGRVASRLPRVTSGRVTVDARGPGRIHIGDDGRDAHCRVEQSAFRYAHQ